MMVAMALGFLFMGAGQATFRTSNPGVAALVIALYPRFPVAPTDNRCHLQVWQSLLPPPLTAWGCSHCAAAVAALMIMREQS